MNNNQSSSDDWRVPPQLIAAAVWLGLPIFVLYVLVALSFAKHAGDTSLLHSAVTLGAVGTVLLFLARLPLYRARRFLAFGPRLLTGGYRKLYYLAYLFIAPSLMMLLLLFFTLR